MPKLSKKFLKQNANRLHYLDIESCSMSNTTFTSVGIENSRLISVDLTLTTFKGGLIIQTSFRHCYGNSFSLVGDISFYCSSFLEMSLFQSVFHSVSYRSVSFKQFTFASGTIECVTFFYCSCTHSTFINSFIRFTSFDRAFFDTVSFNSCCLLKVKFEGDRINFSKGSFTKGSLTDVTFEVPSIVNFTFAEVACFKLSFKGSQIKRCQFVNIFLPDMCSGSSFSIQFEKVVLEGCSFLGYSLSKICFWKGTVISSCSFMGLLLKDCVLADCVIRNTDFRLVRFDSCSLTNVVFENCLLDGAAFLDSQLEGVNLGANHTDVSFVRCQINSIMQHFNTDKLSFAESLNSLRNIEF